RVRQRIDAGWSSDGNLGPTPPARRIWRELGETDEHGHLEATISASRNPFESQGWQNLFFVADKPGCCDTHSGFTNHPFFDGKEVDGEGVTELRFTMRADEPFQGRILRGENGLAGQELAVRIGVKVESKEGNSWRNEDYVRVVTTAEDGSFRVRGVTRIDDEVSVMPTGSPAVREQLPRELHRMAPRQPLALRALKQFPEKGYTVDLAELATLQMQVLDETGGPATDAVVLLLAEVDNDYECDAWTPMAHTDNAGRLAMLVETGRWFLFIRNQTSYAFQTIDVRGGAAADRLDVRLEPMPAMHGKVVDKRGEPLANASVSVHSSSWSSGGNRDKGLEAIANSLNWSWIAAAESDARGMFAIRYLELPGMSYEARLRHEKQSSASFRLEVNDEPQTFVIE
ncbi:MAG: hypothetical protein KDE27_06975, partial [Planctomycetes bacterium]|nr:hypothetical protein [Planctomycetota bacterium]